MTRLISFLAHAVYMGTPLLFGTVGEIQNEKAGQLYRTLRYRLAHKGRMAGS